MNYHDASKAWYGIVGKETLFCFANQQISHWKESWLWNNDGNTCFSQKKKKKGNTCFNTENLDGA